MPDATTRRTPRDLIVARVLTLAPVLLAFPAGIVAVFYLDADRNVTADTIAWAYSVGLFSAFSTAFWPLPGLRGWDLERRALSAAFLFMATAVVHLYSTSYYFLSEIIPGLPNVDTTSFTDTWIKFGLANAPWLTMPWLVLWWGQRALRRLTGSFR